jgi:predicted MFS family arabinose efflux permease
LVKISNIGKSSCTLSHEWFAFKGFASSALLWGAVGDVWGRRNTMMTTLFLCAISTMSSSLAPSFLPLLVFRFFSGFL